MQIVPLREVAAVLGISPRMVQLLRKREGMPGRVTHGFYDLPQCVKWYAARNVASPERREKVATGNLQEAEKSLLKRTRVRLLALAIEIAPALQGRTAEQISLTLSASLAEAIDAQLATIGREHGDERS
jgi:hypothetical protein